MTTFEVHTMESAPAESKPLLADAEKHYGTIPNLFGVFAESPAILEKSTLFDSTERQVVLLTASFENDCDYCMAAHTAIASMQKVPQHVLDSVRAGTAIREPKLEALRVFTRLVVQKRGLLAQHEVEALLAAGYSKRHVLEVVLGVSFKTLSNFTNHIAETPVDASFQRFAWSRPGSTRNA